MATYPGMRFILAFLALLALPAAATTYTAATCSVANVQTAVNSAANGDTVIIPVGSCSWTTGIATSKRITIQGATVGGVTITHVAGAADLFTLTIGGTNRTTIANLRFMPGTGTGNYITINGTGLPPLMHDVYFNLPNFQLQHAVQWFVTGGVIWNATFESTQNLGGVCGQQIGSDSGSLVVKSDKSWDDASTMGTLDVNGDQNLYIEDSVFRNVGQSPDVDDRGRVVMRHIVMQDSSGVIHGPTSAVGGRHVEIYDSVFSYPLKTKNMNRYFWTRGGTLLITGNAIEEINSGACFGNKQTEFTFTAETVKRSTLHGCCTGYMCYRQPGSGSDGTTGHSNLSASQSPSEPYQISDPVYIWNNTGTGQNVGTNEGDLSCPGSFTTDNFFHLNRDYFLNNTGSSTAGAKPGWTRYTYPHPLHSGTMPDTTPPPAPTSPSLTVVSSSALTLTWTGSTDEMGGSGVVGYRVQRCAGVACTSFVQVAAPTTSPFANTGLTPSTSYSYQVAAVDGAGNVSTWSTTATASTSTATADSVLIDTKGNFVKAAGMLQFAPGTICIKGATSGCTPLAVPSVASNTPYDITSGVGGGSFDPASDNAFTAGQSIDQGTITSSVPGLHISQEWDEGSTDFVAMQIDVTNTASGAGAAPILVNKNGSSIFYVDKDGGVGAASLTLGGNLIDAPTDSGQMLTTGSNIVPGNTAVRWFINGQLNFNIQSWGGGNAAAGTLKIENDSATTTLNGYSSTFTTVGLIHANMGSLLTDTDNLLLAASASGKATVIAGGGTTAADVGLTVAGGVAVTHGYTVSELSGLSPVAGARAHVTDAVSCTFLGALIGSGSVVCPVFYNGASWVGG